MTRPHLRPCPSCARHVRVSETACPFCLATVDLAGGPAPVPPAVRLSRAALYALGAGTLSLASACGGTSTTGSPSNDAGTAVDAGVDAAFDAGAAALYGAPPPQDSGSTVAPYGLPPMPEDSGGAVPAYGLSP
jgi:hypothetical protein